MIEHPDAAYEAFMAANYDDPPPLDEYEAGGVRVRWVRLGEGRDGDYDPADRENQELLRFDVEVHRTLADEWDEQIDDDGEWYRRADGSYCTNVPASTPPALRQVLLTVIHRHIGRPPRKRDMEAASWIGPDGTLKRQED